MCPLIRTYDALLEVLVVAVVADLLQQQRVELLEHLEVLEARVDDVEVLSRPLRRPATENAQSIGSFGRSLAPHQRVPIARTEKNFAITTKRGNS